jgi:cystathionine gamma-synthase
MSDRPETRPETRPATVAVHAGRPPHETDQPLNVPITMAST